MNGPIVVQECCELRCQAALIIQSNFRALTSGQHLLCHLSAHHGVTDFNWVHSARREDWGEVLLEPLMSTKQFIYMHFMPANVDTFSFSVVTKQYT